MAGYLMAIHYQVAGVSRPVVLLGIPDGVYPDQATAITASENFVISMRAVKGETATNLLALVSQTR